MSLLNDDFLLTTPMAKKLFHDHAEKNADHRFPLSLGSKGNLRK